MKNDRARLRSEYERILEDLGPWALPFGLHPGAQVAGTGTELAEGRSPTFRSGDVAVYRASADSIMVHRKLPKGGELVFIFDLLEGGGTRLSENGAVIIGDDDDAARISVN